VKIADRVGCTEGLQLVCLALQEVTVTCNVGCLES